MPHVGNTGDQRRLRANDEVDHGRVGERRDSGTVERVDGDERRAGSDAGITRRAATISCSALSARRARMIACSRAPESRTKIFTPPSS
jgi:hypothetical protein